jgi:prophage maintenance system killer protein
LPAKRLAQPGTIFLVDGNKRAVFLAMGLFLYPNGYRLNASRADATLTVLGLAAGQPVLSNLLLKT